MYVEIKASYLSFAPSFLLKWKKQFRVGTKKGRVGSPEPDISFVSPNLQEECQYRERYFRVIA